MLEASGLFYFAVERINKLNRVIWANLGIVEDVLIELISPKGKTFTIDQLKREYGYPDVDLFEIDVDWT